MNSLAAIDINHRSASPVDWASVACDLDANGLAIMPKLLSRAECRSVSDTYSEDTHFRSRIVMARHGFGRGEYKYFAYPLPDRIAKLRAELYRDLANIANRWNQNMGIAIRYPASHAIFLDRCHKAGQKRPTPCSCGMLRATTTVCTKTFTGSMFFLFRLRSFCQSQIAILREVNLF